MNNNYNFSSLFKKANFFSLVVFLLSVIFIIFKGLNYGIDFKGGTLIELRVTDQNIDISQIRQSVSKYNIGDLNIKEFGNKGDYFFFIEERINEDFFISRNLPMIIFNKGFVVDNVNNFGDWIDVCSHKNCQN